MLKPGILGMGDDRLLSQPPTFHPCPLRCHAFLVGIFCRRRQIWAATRTLESEWALDLAKTTLKAILVPPKPEADAAKSAPRKSPRSGVDSAGDGADGADGADAAASPVDGDAETEPDSKGDAGTVEQASTDGSDDAPADGEMGPQKSA